MNDLDVFSARDLRIHSNELFKDAEMGRVSIITKHGKPAVLAVPFDERLVSLGIDKHLALQLFESKLLTMSKAAKLAKISLEEFLDLLAEWGVDAVDYPEEELAAEMEIHIP